MLSDCHPPGITRSARPAHCECYFQIPASAEVKAVPVSSLPPAIQQKIRRLDSCNDGGTAPSVICVSHVTKHFFPVSYQPGAFTGSVAAALSPAEHPLYGQSRPPPIGPNLRPMEENIDPAACLVPVKSSKKTASTILELLQAGDLPYVGKVLPHRGNFFRFNSGILSIKANVLCMHKHRMYLLPEHPAKVSHVDANAQRSATRYPGDTTSSPDSMTDISSNTEDDFIFQDSWSGIEELGFNSDTSVQQDDLSRTRADRWPGGDQSSVTVTQMDETRCHLAEELPSTNENTPLVPTRFTHSEKKEQEIITGYPKDVISSPGTLPDAVSNTEDEFFSDYSRSETDDASANSDTLVPQGDPGNMTPESSGNGNHWPERDKSSAAEIRKDESRCHLAEAICSKKENRSLGPTHFTHSEKREQELNTGYPKDVISSPGTVTDAANNTDNQLSFDYSGLETDVLNLNRDTSVQQDDLGNMTPESSVNGNRWPDRDKSSVGVIQKDETLAVADAIFSREEIPSLGPTHFTHSEKKEMIPVKRKLIKRKISSLENAENVKKKNDLDDSKETRTVLTLSSFSITPPTPSSASPPVGSPSSPSGDPTSFLPCQQSTGSDVFSIPTPLHGVSLIAPTPGGTNTAEATSFSSLTISKSISSTADSAESSRCHVIPASESSLSDSMSRTELISFMDIDEITKDETARRLEERVRELNKIVEAMRMKNQKS